MKKRRNKKYRDTPERRMYRSGGLTSRHIEVAITGSALLSKEGQIARLELVRPAFDATFDGTVTKEQFREVLTVYNVLRALSAIPGVIKGDVREFLATVNETLVELVRRRQLGEPTKPSEFETEVVAALFNLFVDVLDNVSVRQLSTAERAVIERVETGNGVRNLQESQSPQ